MRTFRRPDARAARPGHRGQRWPGKCDRRGRNDVHVPSAPQEPGILTREHPRAFPVTGCGSPGPAERERRRFRWSTTAGGWLLDGGVPLVGPLPPSPAVRQLPLKPVSFWGSSTMSRPTPKPERAGAARPLRALRLSVSGRPRHAAPVPPLVGTGAAWRGRRRSAPPVPARIREQPDPWSTWWSGEDLGFSGDRRSCAGPVTTGPRLRRPMAGRMRRDAIARPRIRWPVPRPGSTGWCAVAS